MPANFQDKVKALYAEYPGGSNKIELGDVQLETITQYIVPQSFISSYGTALPIAEVSQGSVTVNKNVAATLRAKTGIGQGTINVGKIDQETVKLSVSTNAAEGLTAADLTSGFASASAVKSAKQLDQLRKKRERDAFKDLALNFTDAQSVDVSGAADTGAKFALIVEAAEELHKLVDDAQAIDTIDPSMIFIDLDPVLFQELVRLGFAAGRGVEVWENGRFLMANMAGYSVRSNPLLAGAVTKTDGTQVKGFVSTTFAGIAPMRLVAANSGRYDGSNDIVVYSEAKYTKPTNNSGPNDAGFKMIYSGVVKPLV